MFSGYHRRGNGSRKRFFLPDHMPHGRRAYNANRGNRWAAHAHPNQNVGCVNARPDPHLPGSGLLSNNKVFTMTSATEVPRWN
jgi:hypothetical protein